MSVFIYFDIMDYGFVFESDKDVCVWLVSYEVLFGYFIVGCFIQFGGQLEDLDLVSGKWLVYFI